MRPYSGYRNLGNQSEFGGVWFSHLVIGYRVMVIIFGPFPEARGLTRNLVLTYPNLLPQMVHLLLRGPEMFAHLAGPLPTRTFARGGFHPQCPFGASPVSPPAPSCALPRSTPNAFDVSPAQSPRGEAIARPEDLIGHFRGSGRASSGVTR